VKLTPNLTANSTADEHRRGLQHADLIPGINALFVITPEEVRRLQTTHQAIFFFRNKLEQVTFPAASFIWFSNPSKMNAFFTIPNSNHICHFDFPFLHTTQDSQVLS
jgi:hypothetical protein